MKYLSLFSGIGGFELGIQQAYEDILGSVVCIGFSEIDKYAIQIYEKHFKHKNYGDGQVLNAKDFGVPQNRERVFIIGHLGGQPRRKVFPIGESNQVYNGETNEGISKCLTATNYKGIGNDGTTLIADYRNDEGLRIRKKGDAPCLSARRHSETDPSTMSPLVVNPYNGKTSTEETGTLGTSCGTSTGKTAQHIHENSRIRRLTPLECERLMGYPDRWTEGLSDTQRYKTLGNGIVSNVVKEVIKRIL